MIKINLLPYRSERKKEIIIQQAVIGAIPVVIVLLAFAGVWFQQNARISATESEIAQLNQKIADCKLQMKEIDEYKKNKEVLLKKMGVIKNLQKGKNGPVHVLDELATCIPGNIWLTSVTQKGMSLQIEGSAIDNIAVSNYMINLEKSPYINNVDLKTVVDQASTMKSFKNMSLKKFVITCSLTYTPEKTG